MDLLESGVENRHPWELSRGDCVLKLIMSNSLKEAKTICDIGSGDMYFSNILAEKFNSQIYAVDTGYEEIPLAINSRITRMNNISQIDDDTVDIAVLMDVLEHVKKPDDFLKQVVAKCTQGASLYLTVPAFQHLFSSHDTFLKHHRRYNKSLLKEHLVGGGVEIENIFYFYSILYIPRLIQLLLSKAGNRDHSMAKNVTTWGYSESSAITTIMRKFLNLDFRINELARKWPFGLSLCAVCRVNK